MTTRIETTLNRTNRVHKYLPRDKIPINIISHAKHYALCHHQHQNKSVTRWYSRLLNICSALPWQSSCRNSADENCCYDPIELPGNGAWAHSLSLVLSSIGSCMCLHVSQSRRAQKGVCHDCMMLLWIKYYMMLLMMITTTTTMMMENMNCI